MADSKSAWITSVGIIIAGYGIHSTSTRKKTIKVTVNAVFSID
jgi:hypothetical protein